MIRRAIDMSAANRRPLVTLRISICSQLGGPAPIFLSACGALSAFATRKFKTRRCSEQSTRDPRSCRHVPQSALCDAQGRRGKGWRETGSTTCLQPSVLTNSGSGFSPYRQVGQRSILVCAERRAHPEIWVRSSEAGMDARISSDTAAEGFCDVLNRLLLCFAHISTVLTVRGGDLI